MAGDQLRAYQLCKGIVRMGISLGLGFRVVGYVELSLGPQKAAFGHGSLRCTSWTWRVLEEGEFQLNPR